MTEREVKRIEDQIKELQAQVNTYYKDETAKEIYEVEQKYLGKCFRKVIDERSVYLKVLSCIASEAPYKVQCIEFELPITSHFLRKGDYMTFRGFSRPFDYGFNNDLFIFIDDELIKNIENDYEEVGPLNFQIAFETFSDAMLQFMEHTYSLEEVFGGDYAQKILEKKEEK